MNPFLRSALGAAAVAVACQASAQVTFYEHDNFQGRSFQTERQIGDLSRFGFNDRASSVLVLNQRWEVCDDVRFGGKCVVLRPGTYSALSAMGLNDRVSSVRAVGNNARFDENRYAPPPQPVYDNHRRRNERLFEADVTSVRAVVGPAEQRCWVEREQVVQNNGNSCAGGAIVGALIGGILGHQVGGGTGKDIATAGGAVAGAVVGSNMARNANGEQVTSQNVRRCASAPSAARPEFWDVTYNFRGIEHHVQTTAPPGRSITVNRQGEPRA